MIFNIKNNKQFYAFIAVIILIGFIIRFVNINYASMWADELYSALLANPDNSWYEVLYIQRAYQPPLYAFSLWVWVKLFAYNEFYIRLFTLLGGVACIYVSGILGKKMHSYKLGIILAVIVAFNPVQIWYSLEARFYIFVFLFSAISLLIYWITLQNLKFNWILMLVKAINDAALCYSHHFGLVFIGVLAYSYFPMRFMTGLGIICFLGGIIYALIIVLMYFLGDIPFKGWAPIMILVLVLSGIQMLMLGIIGEYLWRTLDQSRDRPAYLIDEIIE